MSQTQTTEGTVDEVLPRALFKVALADGSTLIAALHGSAKHSAVHVLPGTKVQVEVSSQNPTRGRIVQV